MTVVLSSIRRTVSSSSKNGPASGSSAVGNIEHVVVLMFENRSFDHILGAMPGVDGVLDANGKVLPDLYNTMNRRRSLVTKTRKRRRRPSCRLPIRIRRFPPRTN